MQYLSVLIIFVNYKPAFSPHSEDKHKTHKMIIIDKEIIKQERNPKTDDALLIAIGKQLKEIDGWFNRPNSVVKLKWHPRYVYRNPVTGVKEEKAMSSIGFEAVIKIGGKNRHVIYAEREENSEGTKPIYSPRSESFTGHAVFTENDTERLLWYLMFEPRVKNGVIVREDLSNDAEKLATKRKQSVDLQFYLYSDASPLDDARLRVIARNWAIDDSKFDTIDMLKNRLFDAIQTEEGRTEKAIAEFKEQVSSFSDEIKAVSVVAQGVYKKVIEFDHNASQWQWKGDKDNPILKINPNDRGNDILLRKRLAQFLIASEKLYLLKEAIGDTDEDVEETSIDIRFDKHTQWDKLKWPILKKALREAGVKFKNTDTQPTLIEMCQKTYADTEA